MNLSCALGLAVCLNYLGSKIPEDDAFVISYYCEELKSLPTHSFLLHSGDYESDRRGYNDADELERLGLKFRWKPDGRTLTEHFLAEYRRQELLRACTEFNQISGSSANWSS